jgi:hypothetical protein
MEEDDLKETSMLEEEMEEDEPDILDMGVVGAGKKPKKVGGDEPHDVASDDDEDIDALAEEEEDKHTFDDIDLI